MQMLVITGLISLIFPPGLPNGKAYSTQHNSWGLKSHLHVKTFHNVQLDYLSHIYHHDKTKKYYIPFFPMTEGQKLNLSGSFSPYDTQHNG